MGIQNLLNTGSKAIRDASDSDSPRSFIGTERWSYHFHLSLVDGRKVSAFISFQRTTSLDSQPPSHAPVNGNQLLNESEGQLSHSHIVNFAISEPIDAANNSRGLYHSSSAMDSSYLNALRRAVEAEVHMDPFIHDSLVNMLSRGGIPAPDILIPGDVVISTHGPLNLRYGNLASAAHVSGLDERGAHHVVAHEMDGAYGFELDFTPEGNPIDYDCDGTSCSSFPAGNVSGTVRLDNSSVAVDSSHSTVWYERETIGDVQGRDEEAATQTERAWTRVLLQLNNGWAIELREFWDVDIFNDEAVLRNGRAVLSSPDGSCITTEIYTFQTLATWSSMATLNDYGTKWSLVVDQAGIDLSIEAAFPQQEFVTISAGRAYWKGRVSVNGKLGGDPVNGFGFVENRPAQLITKLEKHLKRAARLTNIEVSKIYPERLVNPEHAMKTFGFNSKDYLEPDPVTGTPLRYMQDVPLDVLYQHVFAPVRHLVNGTGKSWRSYMSMLSISLLGADPEPFRPLVAAIELVHTGTLIIDDIQDESPLRRGVPAVHTVWGIASAINAGEAAYFAFHTAIQSIQGLSAETKLGVLEIFFEAMRFAHAGQALDIAGQQQALLDDILGARVEPSALEKAILSVHRLKTAVVASSIAKMSAVLAGAPPIQTQTLAAHWERVGLAFQIIDDVYDIRRGSHSQDQKEDQRTTNKQVLKRRGDDIRSGKISIPIAKAGQMMPLNEARWVWETVLSKPGDDDVTTQAVIDKLEAYGIVDACIAEAQKMVDDSWLVVEKHLTDSQAKVFIHAVCRYMGEYHSI